MRKRLSVDPADLHFGGAARVPSLVEMCPECGGYLIVRSFSWDALSGQPHGDGLQIDCVRDEKAMHRYFQSDWQAVVDKVRKWAGCTTE